MELDLNEIRERVINSTLIAFILLLFPALAISLSRFFILGWIPVFTVHITLTVLFCFIWLFRKKLNFYIKAHFVILTFFLIDFASVIFVGANQSRFYFLIGLSFASLFLSKKVSWAYFVGAISIFVSLGLFQKFGILRYGIAQPAYLESWAHFGNQMMGIVFGGGILVYTIRTFRSYLIQAVESLQENNRVITRSKKQLERTLNQLPIPVLISRHHELVHVNQEFRDMLGYTDTDINLADSKLNSSHPAYYAINALPTQAHHPIYLNTKQGRQLIVEITEGFLGPYKMLCFIDVTAREIAVDELKLSHQKLEASYIELSIINEELEEAQYRARQSDKLKSAFLATMSHEIRTPMNGIIGFAEMMKNFELTPEKYKAYAEIISTSSLQLLSVMNDIIDFSKIEAGVVDLYLKRFDLNRQLQELFHVYEPMARKKHLCLLFSSQSVDGSTDIICDSGKLKQVVENLLNNAIKFTSVGTVELGFVVGTNEIQIYVKDTGTGIERENQLIIFERFSQVDNLRQGITQGTGLGLTIAKAYVERMNGRIDLTSEINKGSIFTVVLPRWQT